MSDFVKESFLQAKDVLLQFIEDGTSYKKINLAIDHLVKCFQSGGKVLSCGNGGSMCDAIHFAEELSGRYRKDRRPLPALAVSDPGYISCVANDYGYDEVFSRYVEGVSKEGDILLAISTSGTSTNVINAIKTAREKKVLTLALLGKDGGLIKEIADLAIVVPSQSTDRIQEIHIKIIHTLIEGIERSLFPQNY